MRVLFAVFALTMAVLSRAVAAERKADDPVTAMLNEQYESTNEQAEYWGGEDEAIFDGMASSEIARSPRSREILWSALRSGQALAAGVLWRLDRDPKVVDFLVDALKRKDYKPPFGRDEVAFVLGYTRDRRALPALWAEMEGSPQDPYRQCAAAKAIYRISHDRKIPAILRGIRGSVYPPIPNHEASPQSTANMALEDLGLEPLPEKSTSAAPRSFAAVPPAVHPLRALLERTQEEFERNPAGDPWTTAGEAAIAGLSKAPEARLTGSREVLWSELRAGRLFAAAPLWDVYRDSAAVAFVAESLGKPRPGGGSTLDVPFVLGYLRAPAAVPALWRAIERSDKDPFQQLFCARAVYRINRDPKALAAIKRLAGRRHPQYETAEVSFDEMARDVLEDVGSKP